MATKTKKTQLYVTCKDEKKVKALNQITDYLKEHYASYILITCTEPSEAGQMHAELSYCGEEALVSYLVDHVTQMLEEKNSAKDLCTIKNL